MAAELGLNPKKAKRAGLLHDIGKVSDDENRNCRTPILGMKLAEKYKEKSDICNAIGAHHDENRNDFVVGSDCAGVRCHFGCTTGCPPRDCGGLYQAAERFWRIWPLSYPGVVKTYAIQAGRELRVIVGADKIDDAETEKLSSEIARKIQTEMTYPVR